MNVEWGLLEPVETMSADVFARWLDECYLDTRANQLLADPDVSVVILSPPGTGLSTALALVPQQGLLTYAYPPTSWPGQPEAFTEAEAHFDQWMGHIANQIGLMLQEATASFLELDSASHEFLLWVNQRYRGQRQRELWLRTLRQRLPPDLVEELQARVRSPDFTTLYGDTGSDVASQIEECLTIARALDQEGIFAAVDVGWADWVQRSSEERSWLTSSLRLLLSTLTPLQRPRFGMKVALSTNLGLALPEIQRLVRGRAMTMRWEWPEAQVRELVGRYVVAATEGRCDPGPWLAHWAQLYEDCITIWGLPGAAAAVALARQILLQAEAGQPADLQALREGLFRTAAPLYVDPVPELRTVWRGQQPITLDEAPFRLLSALWADRGRKTGHQRLVSIAGSQSSLDQTIKRIRAYVEPFYSKDKAEDKDKTRPLYLQRTRGSYTWIEHVRTFD